MTTLTREAFKAWLKSKQPEEIVGRARLCSGCPVATYLEVTTGKVTFVFGTKYVNVENLATIGIASVLPLWSQQFIAKVDDGPQYVEAYHALTLLDQIET